MARPFRRGIRWTPLATACCVVALSAVPAEAMARTQVTFRGDPGEFITGGKRYVYTPGNAKISLKGSRGYMELWIRATRRTGYEQWRMYVQPAANTLLRRGVTYHATRYPFSRGGVGFALSGLSHGCNELTADFRIVHWRLERGWVRSLSFMFVQYCEKSPPALHGRVDWRV